MQIEDRKPFERHFTDLKEQAQDHVPTWKELSEYIAPERGFFEGQQPNRHQGIDHRILLDNTATKDLRVLASGMMGGLTSPSHPWFKIAISDRDLMQSEAVKKWLDDVRTILMDIYSRSNIYNMFYTIYEELGAFNVAAGYIGEDFKDVIRCRTFTIGEYYLGVDYSGRVNSFAREYWMTSGQLVKQFGIDNVSIDAKSAYQQNNLEKWFQVYQLIEPNDDRIPNKKDSKNMLFRSIYWEPGSPTNNVLRYSGYHEFPIVAPRWDTLGNDSYGRNGPGRLAIGDSKTLQLLCRDGLMALDKMNDPPIVKPARVDTVNTAPGGVTIKDNSSQDQIGPLYTVDPQLQALELYKKAYQTSIDEAFYKDLFLLITNIARSGVTATEINAKQQEQLLQLGPIITRLSSECYDPIIERTFNIANRVGMIPKPPQELEGMEIQVEYISVFAQAQKMVGTTAIKETVSFAGSLISVQPNIVDKINFDEALDRIADMNGVPPGVIRGDEEVAQIRKQREQAAQQQAQMQQMQVAAQGAKTLSETNTEGNNALTALLGGGQ
jgi:hypothetical protein